MVVRDDRKGGKDSRKERDRKIGIWIGIGIGIMIGVIGDS
jgi:hypothetical protein